MFDVTYPAFLILLAALPFLIFVLRQTKVASSKWRQWLTFSLRCSAIFCAVLALANLQRTHHEQRLAVVFLIDTSDSVAKSERMRAFQKINAAVAKLKPTDLFGIIGFAQETSILQDLRPKAEQPLVTSMDVDATISSAGTDILAALKRAIALLPEGYQRRIVLFSDGIHNAAGTALIDYLPLIQASNVEILTVPLQTVRDALQVHQLQLPAQVRKGQPFSIAAIVETDGSIRTVNATLYHNDVPIYQSEWTLPSGKNQLALPAQQLSEEGIHTYQLKLNVTDEIPENNSAYEVVKVQGKRQAIYVENGEEVGKQGAALPLKTVLVENGFEVEMLSPPEIPTELVNLQRSDVLILSNISADAFSTQQLSNIERYVSELGHGLVVIGGDNAFGPGGYADTALERVLPVEMTPRERKDSIALFFVIDISGSMANYVETQQKIQLAIEGVRAGIRNLKDEDVAGLIGFNTEVYVIAQLTSEHDTLRQAAGTLRPTGGTTKMKEALDKAGDILKAADAKRKHIILLSDGNSAGERSDFLTLANELTRVHIGITTLAIGDADKALLEEVATVGGGRSRYVQNVQELPVILMETVKQTQSYILQEPFQPILTDLDAPLLEGIRMLPRLHGYVATAEKEFAQLFIRSHRDEPILAGWNFGLGKSIAWTSDVKPAWAREWVPWQNFGRFWGQVVNWTLRTEDEDTDFELNVLRQNSQGEVIIDTQRPSQATYHLHVAGPDGSRDIATMQQTTPTRYTGNFRLTDSGAYIVTVKRASDNRKLTATLSFAYPAEYAEFRVNSQLLKSIGIYEPSVNRLVQHSGEPIENRVSLAHTLLIVALILFVLEMILRRMSIANHYLSELWGRLWNKPNQNVPEMLIRLTRKKADAVGAPNSQVAVPMGAARATAAAYKNTHFQNSTEQETGNRDVMSQLLDAKRKARSAYTDDL